MPRKQAERIDIKVGQRIRHRRDLLGISQDQLGQHLGLSFQQVQKYETGKNRISAGRLLQIADFLSLRIETLFEGLLPSGSLPPVEEETRRERIIKFAMSREGATWNDAYLNAPDPRQRKIAMDVLRLPLKPNKS